MKSVITFPERIPTFNLCAFNLNYVIFNSQANFLVNSFTKSIAVTSATQDPVSLYNEPKMPLPHPSFKLTTPDDARRPHVGLRTADSYVLRHTS